jgi:hypothetical protein
MKKELIKNGTCKANDGVRSITLDLELNIMPVMYGVYNGPMSMRCTYQVKGPFIVTSTWGKNYTTGIIGITNNGIGLDDKQTKSLYEAICAKYHWVKEFMETPVFNTASIIPIPESEWITTKSKQIKFKKFYDKFGIVFNEDIYLSKKEDINFIPKELDFNPDTYTPYVHMVNGQQCKVVRTENWYGSFGNGESVPLIFNTDVEVNQNTEKGTCKIKGNLGVYGWRSYPYIIRIINGFRLRFDKDGNHTTYGTAVNVWSVHCSE